MKHTVLIVEDEEDLREMMRSLLAMSGFDVVAAADGREALALAASVGQVCVVLLDLLMPGMNGWDFFEAFKASSSHASTPVIVTTSVPSRAPKGATLVLSKPLDPERLIAEVHRCCAP